MKSSVGLVPPRQTNKRRISALKRFSTTENTQAMALEPGVLQITLLFAKDLKDGDLFGKVI